MVKKDKGEDKELGKVRGLEVGGKGKQCSDRASFHPNSN